MPEYKEVRREQKPLDYLLDRVVFERTYPAMVQKR